MRSLRALAMLCVLLAPSWASCRAQASRKVYHMTDSLTLVEHGDTVLFVRSADDAAPRDAIAPDGKPVVLVALLRADSTYVLLSGKRTPMNPTVAKHVRAMLTMARDEAAGRLPRPPGLKQ